MRYSGSWMIRLACAGAVAGTAPALAQDASPLHRLLACKSIAEAAARLSCYDERARDVDGAIARRDLVVASHEQVTATRRSLFGLALPRIPLLEGRPDDEAGNAGKGAAPDRLETTLRSAAKAGDRWILELAEGGRWEQVDAGRDADEPRAGMAITIRRASFGTYFARIGARISMRIKRVG